MRESTCGATWRKSSAFNFSGAMILNALAEIISVLIMQKLLRGHVGSPLRAALGRNTNLGAMEERPSRARMKSPGQRRGATGGGRGFHSEMAREGALAHLPSQRGR